ncbi:ROK family protein [Saccharothrix longispora]|uniref:Glucokinase n=1 Tax=Saccharothrix longispora TaxID=33920 RepID=A0ABU1Q2P7_9PSEU|nr:ROK family protein [Saccharothrix longispora]MDR6596399.1 glucokinase [Saccharothrix longispora]
MCPAPDPVAVALDIGGTKLAAALVGPDGTVLARRTAPTPAGDAGTVWRALAGVVTEVVDHAAATGRELLGVGIASAAPMDLRTGTVSPVNIPGWRDFPVTAHVAGLLPGLPVRLGGDALCMALAEYHHGTGRGSACLLGMVVSTGVGGGFVFDGRPHFGTTGNAGHVGHFVVDPAGPLCGCGAQGCSEAVASGPAMVRWALEQGWRPLGGAADGVALAASARAGDPAARAAFRRSGEAVARVVTVASALCEIDRVVIGGGVAQAWDLLEPAVVEPLAAYSGLDFMRRVEVRPATLGVDSGLIGAAALLAGLPHTGPVVPRGGGSAFLPHGPANAASVTGDGEAFPATVGG